ncbi:hypothetical protein MOQ_002404 [Trypanosoma cruzi marinkellei]|uniref:J domain-containing protein n=1 Tax=Trypanosoma cruzi marinkellei TaxID=85056 RepID=K2MF89_TRYCR|nr:hypothetical protein MOQ_002404 [Trypanosoma cruzi marinkellei]
MRFCPFFSLYFFILFLFFALHHFLLVALPLESSERLLRRRRGGGGVMDAVVLAQSVLDCDDGAVLQVLSLAPGLPPVTAETPVAEARRNYMRLAGMVHPDKLKGRFERSTEAFQKLVRAFELVADPKYRKKLLSLQAKEERKKQSVKKEQPEGTQRVKQITASKGTVAVVRSAGATDMKPKRAASKQQQQPKKKKQKRAPKVQDDDDDDDDDDFIDYDEEELDEEEEEDESADYDEEDMDFDFGDAEPVVSTSRTLIGAKRTGGIYRDTTVSCPQCRTPWIPDSKQHYTLFMGPCGKKVHCETCLCRFGCATALHACPYCQHSFHYDATMYDTVMECSGCHKTFGFPYYPVNQYLIDQVRLEEWRDRTEREKAREREERAARRRNTDEGTSDDFLSLVGACIVNETCPICKRTITARHRQHVEMCLKNENKGSTALTTKTTKAAAKKTARKPAAVANKTSTRKSAPKQAKKSKKRRRSEDSDSDDEEESFYSSSEE